MTIVQQEPLALYGPRFSVYVRSARIYCDEVKLEHTSTMSPQGDDIAFKSVEHLTLNPFGKIPVLCQGDFVLFETAAICRYLDRLAGDNGLLNGLTPPQVAAIDQWTTAIAYYAKEAVMQGFLLELAFPKGEGGEVRMDVVLDNLPQAREFLTIIEHQLEQHTWLVSDQYSMADAVLTPFLDYLATIPELDKDGLLIPAGSLLADYVARVRARPSARVLKER